MLILTHTCNLRRSARTPHSNYCLHSLVIIHPPIQFVPSQSLCFLAYVMVDSETDRQCICFWPAPLRSHEQPQAQLLHSLHSDIILVSFRESSSKKKNNTNNKNNHNNNNMYNNNDDNNNDKTSDIANCAMRLIHDESLRRCGVSSDKTTSLGTCHCDW